MKYYIIKNFDLIHYGFDVKDENGNKIYKIKTLRSFLEVKTVISDMNDKQVICIERKKTFLPSYSVFINDSINFDIELKPTFQKRNYLLSNGYRVEGDYRGFNHILFDDNNQPIAKMKKSFFTQNRKCEIDILDINKTEIALAVAKVVALPFAYNPSKNN